MGRFPSDVNPRALNVDPDKKPRHRKRRGLPPPPDFLKAGEAKADAALRRLPASPGILLEPAKKGRGWVNSAPHSDWLLWDTQLHEAFGTRSRSLVKVFLDQLKGLVATNWASEGETNDWKPNETELNAVLALVADIKPKNATEAALAAQMVAVHLVTMNLARDAFNHGSMVMEKSASLMGKLARTYTMQLETLRLLRGGKKPTIRQAITVKRETHYHQHVHDHRAASEAGGVHENEGQPYEAEGTRTIEGSATLRGEEPGGDVVPITRNAG